LTGSEYLLVPIPRQLTTVAFETTLAAHYAPTIAATSIHFDLSSTTWSDLFEISLLALWVGELRLRGARILITLPREQSRTEAKTPNPSSYLHEIGFVGYVQ
jgi:hypothetical protein